MTGEELAQARERAGLTQDQFAYYVGIGRTSLWRLETGREEIGRPIEEMAKTLAPGNGTFDSWLRTLPAKTRNGIIRRQHKNNFKLAIGL